MNDHDTHTTPLSVEEAWIADWALAGLEAIERHLARRAAFAEFLRTRPPVDSGDDDADGAPDA